MGQGVIDIVLIPGAAGLLGSRASGIGAVDQTCQLQSLGQGHAILRAIGSGQVPVHQSQAIGGLHTGSIPGPRSHVHKGPGSIASAGAEIAHTAQQIIVQRQVVPVQGHPIAASVQDHRVHRQGERPTNGLFAAEIEPLDGIALIGQGLPVIGPVPGHPAGVNINPFAAVPGGVPAVNPAVLYRGGAEYGEAGNPQGPDHETADICVAVTDGQLTCVYGVGVLTSIRRAMIGRIVIICVVRNPGGNALELGLGGRVVPSKLLGQAGELLNLFVCEPKLRQTQTVVRVHLCLDQVPGSGDECGFVIIGCPGHGRGAGKGREQKHQRQQQCQTTAESIQLSGFGRDRHKCLHFTESGS